MANPQPDQQGLARYRGRRWTAADEIVRREIANLAERTDLPPVKALRAVADAVRGRGISRRSLQRHWSADIDTLRETLRGQYLPPKARALTEMIDGLLPKERLGRSAATRPPFVEKRPPEPVRLLNRREVR